MENMTKEEIEILPHKKRRVGICGGAGEVQGRDQGLRRKDQRIGEC